MHRYNIDSDYARKTQSRMQKYILLTFQIVAHLACIPLIIYGHWWQWLLVIFVYFLNGCLGMTMTYHKLLTHNSWPAPRWFRYVGTMCATIGLTGSAIPWVAIHREHHRYTDTDRDPHSPHHKGWFGAHYLSMFSKVNVRYVPDLLKEPFMLFQHKHYFVINLAYGAVLYMIDPMAVLYAWLVPAAILWNAGSSIVTFSHMYGYKNSETSKNESRNNVLLAFLVWGEGWHDNHHAHPADANFGGRKWWEIDISYQMIKLLSVSPR